MKTLAPMGSTINNNQFECNNDLTSPANGDDNEFGDSGLVQDIDSLSK